MNANPASNQIGPGLSEEALVSAVEESGYPLQVFVSDLLRERFFIEEEWSYLDRDSGSLRALDLRATRRLYVWEGRGEQPRVRPVLNLLIECKQSELPYIFFESSPQNLWLNHPIVHGLHDPTINVRTDDSRSGWTFHVIHALGLQDHPFQSAPRVSKIFSKCVRKGPKVELSGTDAYSHLILPLVKALNHLGSVEDPPDTAVYFDAHLSVALGVLDAPMLVARLESGRTALELAPWVRVIRHEYSDNESKLDRDRHWCVDVIHRDYLKSYLESSLEPFAAVFAERVLRHGVEIATAKAFASGMEENSWSDIEARMRPR